MQTTIQYIKNELQGIYPNPEIDALTRIMFEWVCNLNYSDLIIQRNKKIRKESFYEIEKIIGRLKTNEPIQYILGQTEFFGLTLKVNRSVLIPRPETEELVALILKENKLGSPKILDIGTGSGCIALALKSKLPKAEIEGIDVSEQAIQTAKSNSSHCNFDVCFFQNNIFEWENKSWPVYDIIVSNPPYVRESEQNKMHANVLQFEPGNALFVSDENPLVFYQVIADFAKKTLKKEGQLYFEINEELGEEMIKMLNKSGFNFIKIFNDINNKNRMLRCIKK